MRILIRVCAYAYTRMCVYSYAYVRIIRVCAVNVYLSGTVGNVTSVCEYSKIVTTQQLGDRIMHIMHISPLKYNS